MNCPQCGSSVRVDARFCSQCGTRLEASGRSADERKKVTIFFSDISGYTALSEKLDPEEVKDIMSIIFSKAAVIVKEHDGHLDKFIGDCVMAVFGFDVTREDDALRALRAALEIHRAVSLLNTEELKRSIGRDLSVHTGVNTGVVVAGDLDLEKGTEKVLGDTVNVASRLASAAGTGEIVVGRATLREVDRYFEFQELGPIALKGRSGGVFAYRFVGPHKDNGSESKLKGRRAAFTGRAEEMKLLTEYLQMVKNGEKAVCFIHGEAGTGKSRLTEEVKHVAAADGMAVFEASCLEYARGIPYSLWTGFFGRLYSLMEKETSVSLESKIREGCAGIHVDGKQAASFIAGLFAVESDEIRSMDAGFLKGYTQKSIAAMVSSVCGRKPSVLILDDLHWADPSSLEALLLVAESTPGFVICLNRPSDQVSALIKAMPEGMPAKQLLMEPFTGEDSARMIQSLLEGSEPPQELLDFVNQRIKGNPFYIEEIVNNLAESRVLNQANGCWTLSRKLESVDIPSTVQGIISARIDRLEPRQKHLLQTASVIGQNFLRSVLVRVEEAPALEESLETLKERGLIREHKLEPDLEYMFKHALMQDVVYNSLLKKDRRRIHESVARAMEELFAERLSEFYEAIAFHYRQSENTEKAVSYLMMAGKKSIGRFAAAEANEFFQSAYDLLTAKPLTDADRPALVRLINKWGWIQYFYGDFNTSVILHERHIADAEAVADAELKGIFYSWYAYALQESMRSSDAVIAGERALAIGRDTGNGQVTCHASIFLSYIYMRSVSIERSIEIARQAVDLAKDLPDDGYLRFKSLYGLGYSLSIGGSTREALATFERQIDYGIRTGNSRALSLGYSAKAYTLSMEGSYEEAERLFQLAFEYAKDDYYFASNSINYCIHAIWQDTLDRKAQLIEEIAVLVNGRNTTYQFAIEGFRSVLQLKQGRFTKAFKTVDRLKDAYRKSGSAQMISEVMSIIGNVYLVVLTSREPVRLKTALFNLFWILMNVPFAFTKARKAFLEALEHAEKIGAHAYTARALFDLGLLHKAKKKHAHAQDYFRRAEALYKKLDDERLLGAVREELEDSMRK